MVTDESTPSFVRVQLGAKIYNSKRDLKSIEYTTYSKVVMQDNEVVQDLVMRDGQVVMGEQQEPINQEVVMIANAEQINQLLMAGDQQSLIDGGMMGSANQLPSAGDDDQVEAEKIANQNNDPSNDIPEAEPIVYDSNEIRQKLDMLPSSESFTQEEIQKIMQACLDMQEEKLTHQEAAAKYGIPEQKLLNYIINGE